MKTFKPLLASRSLAFRLSLFAQDTEMAMIPSFELTGPTSESILAKEISVAKTNKITKNTYFRANAHVSNVRGYLRQNLQFPDEATFWARAAE